MARWDDRCAKPSQSLSCYCDILAMVMELRWNGIIQKRHYSRLGQGTRQDDATSRARRGSRYTSGYLGASVGYIDIRTSVRIIRRGRRAVVSTALGATMPFRIALTTVEIFRETREVGRRNLRDLAPKSSERGRSLQTPEAHDVPWVLDGCKHHKGHS